MYLLYYIIYNRRNINRFLGGGGGWGKCPSSTPPGSASGLKGGFVVGVSRGMGLLIVDW